jgi:succinate dehydrogenase/fumarate reductase flavoprotein subunit
MAHEAFFDPTEWLRDDFIIAADEYEVEQTVLSELVDQLEMREQRKAIDMWNKLRLMRDQAEAQGAALWKKQQLDIALERARALVHATGGEDVDG